MPELTEGRYAGEFVVSEGNGSISRETITVLAGENRSRPRWRAPSTGRAAIGNEAARWTSCDGKGQSLGSDGDLTGDRLEGSHGMAGQGGEDRWTAGDLYEPYVGRWSRLVAQDFLGWLGAPSGLHWLEVGCGTGALTETIAGICIPKRLVAIDSSPGFLDFARQRLGPDRAEFREANAQSLPFSVAEFDRVVSGLVMNFVPDHACAAAEMARVARPDGEVALYVWDYAGKMELMRYFWDAAAALDPRAAEMDEGKRFPVCRPEALQGLFEAAGLADVETRAIDVPTVFRDFDDYWSPFLGGQGPAPGYCTSLSEDAQTTLREQLRAALPAHPDGSIHLTARAWAVRGRKSS